MSEKKPFEIRGYKKWQLAEVYNISRLVLNQWLNTIENLGEYKGRCYTPAQVQKIVNHLGEPPLKN